MVPSRGVGVCPELPTQELVGEPSRGPVRAEAAEEEIESHCIVDGRESDQTPGQLEVSTIGVGVGVVFAKSVWCVWEQLGSPGGWLRDAVVMRSEATRGAQAETQRRQ